MPEIIPNWHPIFVNFVVALISVSTLLCIVGRIMERFKIGKELLITARWCLWFGAAAAMATVSAGFIAYYSVAHDMPSHLAMTEHRNWAITAFIAILLVTIWSGWLYFKKKSVGLWFILAMIVTELLLMAAAWFGAEVVFRHGIGVQSLPKAAREGHQHSHSRNKKTSPDSHQSVNEHKKHQHGD